MTAVSREMLQIGWCAKRKYQEGRRVNTGTSSPCSIREIVFNNDDQTQTTYNHWSMCRSCQGDFENQKFVLVDFEIKASREEGHAEGVNKSALENIFSDLRHQVQICWDEYYDDEDDTRYDNVKTRLDNVTNEMKGKVHSLILKTRARNSEIQNVYGKSQRQQ